jgi:general secretion pathway protein C
VAGALLSNGVRIAEIYADSVVLERDGRRVRLYVDEAKALLARNSAGFERSMMTVGGTSPVAVAQATSREVLTDFVRPSPVYEGGVMVGYQVYAGEQEGVFAQLGLKPGDVITSLDGAPLNDPASAWESLRQLVEGVSLAATVRRGNTVESLTLDGALLQKAKERAANPVLPSAPPRA